MKRFLFTAMLLISAIITAEDTAVKVEYEIDWSKGELAVDLIMSANGKASPSSIRSEAYSRGAIEIGRIFCEILYEIPLDSFRTVKDAVQNDPVALSRLLEFAESGEPYRMYLNPELNSITASYQFSFFPEILSIFTTHEKTYSATKMLGFSPSIDYSGIVIYVQDKYPVHGESPGELNPAEYAPALLPKIYDTDMRLIAESRMMYPNTLLQWGAAGFTTDIDFFANQRRSGPAPLLTMARAVFGKNRSDILIPVDAADRILASEHNRELIRQGRILIIYGSTID